MLVVDQQVDPSGIVCLCVCVCVLFIYSVAQQPPVGQSHLSIEATRSHSDTPHLLGLLWTSNQSDAETST